jgi:hypothetical protein
MLKVRESEKAKTRAKRSSIIITKLSKALSESEPSTSRTESLVHTLMRYQNLSSSILDATPQTRNTLSQFEVTSEQELQHIPIESDPEYNDEYNIEQSNNEYSIYSPTTESTFDTYATHSSPGNSRPTSTRDLYANRNSLGSDHLFRDNHLDHGQFEDSIYEMKFEGDLELLPIENEIYEHSNSSEMKKIKKTTQKRNKK